MEDTSGEATPPGLNTSAPEICTADKAGLDT